MIKLISQSSLGTISCDDIVLLGVGRNEMIRAPSFLRHYRSLGVKRFCLVDNESTDGTREFLEAQPDVELWCTSQAYGEANCGHDWIRALLRLNVGQWCVVADFDEYFIFPGCQHRSLKDFAIQLSLEGATAVSSILFDMYSTTDIKENFLHDDENPIDKFRYYDPVIALDNLHHPLRGIYPIHSKGGMRKRIFGIEPCLNKISFFHNLNGTHLLQGAHYIDGATFSSTPVATLHFKYLQQFSGYAQAESIRGEHFNGGSEYKAYVNILDNNPVVKPVCEESRELIDIDEFLQQQLVRCVTPKFASNVKNIPLVEYKVASLIKGSIGSSKEFFEFNACDSNLLCRVLELTDVGDRPIIIFSNNKMYSNAKNKLIYKCKKIKQVNIDERINFLDLSETIDDELRINAVVVLDAVNLELGRLRMATFVDEICKKFEIHAGRILVNISNAALFHGFDHDVDGVDIFFGKIPRFSGAENSAYFLSANKKNANKVIQDRSYSAVENLSPDVYFRAKDETLLLASAIRSILIEWGFELAEHFSVLNMLTVFQFNGDELFDYRPYLVQVEGSIGYYYIDHGFFSCENLTNELPDLAMALKVKNISYASALRVLNNMNHLS
ncbi:glycosyltransferase family 2 protein [Duganella levis]|uniref:Glycosyltransferase family 2 protein n=1 Tax=Duganella levis TaxID=2692169 RepID=A0ABW9W7Q3_9BURK|nr:glycosyltransferase family 2 protein [Duganella levis]MYN30112.1 hypothetical protein [Duganella levis]